MARRHVHTRGESAVNLAGWLFADIFLALVVVGLSMSWIKSDAAAPVPDESVASTTSSTTTTTTVPAGPPQFQLSCEEFFIGPELLESRDNLTWNVELAIRDELVRRGLSPEEAKPGLVLVLGGYDGDDVRGGDQRATQFVPVLRAAVPSFGAVEMRNGGSRVATVNGERRFIGGPGAFGALVYLVYVGDPRQEDCTR